MSTTHRFKPLNIRASHVLISLLFLCLTGCVQEHVVVEVNPDGSGQVIWTAFFNPSVVQFGKEVPAKDEGTVPLYTYSDKPKTEREYFLYLEDRMKTISRKMGEGVELTKCEKIDTDKAKGALGTFAFSDVSKLKLNESVFGMGEGGEKSLFEVSFDFRKAQRKEAACLKVKRLDWQQTIQHFAKDSDSLDRKIFRAQWDLVKVIECDRKPHKTGSQSVPMCFSLTMRINGVIQSASAGTVCKNNVVVFDVGRPKVAAIAENTTKPAQVTEEKSVDNPPKVQSDAQEPLTITFTANP